ncbi:helix-turn-helix domain-containing protein [Pseudonocardia sp. NPDC046786]|uniref:PucR family transcriptional regulator n=1 Tax=Pseudonocardia sp. NPDC046786 TaxID=3155471 RepID=UPI003407D85F
MARPLMAEPDPGTRPGPVLVPDPPDPLVRLLGGLSAAVLDGAGPERLVIRAAELLGLPVALRSPDLGRVRCWSAPAAFRLDAPPPLPATALAVPGVRRAVARLGPARPSVVLPPDPVHGPARRHLLAVLTGEDGVAGYLDVAELGRPLRPADTPAAEQAAAILSVQLLGETVAERAVARDRDDVLTDLLHGTRDEPDLRRLAVRAGLDPAAAHLLVRFPVRDGRSASGCRDAVADALGGAAGDAVGDLPGAVPAVLPGPDAVLALLELPADPAPGGLRAVHRALRGRLDRIAAVTGVRRAVVSGAVREISGLPAALAETGDVDRLAAALGGTADVVGVPELRTLRLVVDGGRAAAAARFAEQCLGPLRRSDAETGGDLVETLRRYLAAGAQVRAAAARLGVHENTVRYRLGRIEHLTGLDMRRFDALLTAQLALQVDVLAAGAAPLQEGTP